MSKIDQLIQQLCPDGVEFKKIWEVTYWDKKFNGVENYKQPLILKFKHILASELKSMWVKEGDIKLLSTGKFDGYTTSEFAEEFINEGEIVAIPSGGSANIKYYNGKFVDSGNILCCTRDQKLLNLKYFYYFLLDNNKTIDILFRGTSVKHPNMPEILEISIPIPPLEVQEEIVGILDKFTALEAELEAELEARKKQYEYYRNKLLNFDGKDVEWKTLGAIGKVSMCKRVMKNETSQEGEIPFYKIGTFGKTADSFISKELYEDYKKRFAFPKKGDILISASGTIGRTVIYDGEPAYFQDSNIVWLDNDESLLLNKFLYYYYSVIKWETDGGTIARLYNDRILKTKVPIPCIEQQIKIIGILDKFDALVNDLSIGIPAEIEARRKQYEYYRNKLLTFKEVTRDK